MAEPLFKPLPTTPLFPKTTEPLNGVAETTANDVAQQATLANNQPEMFDEYRDVAKTDGTVEDEAYNIIRDQVAQGNIQTTIDFENFENFTLPERQEALMWAVERADARKLSNRQMLTVQLVAGGMGHLPASKIEDIYLQYTLPQYEQWREEINTRQSRELQQIVDELVAGEGWDTWGGAVADIAFQELTPFFNVASKIGFQEIWMNELEIGNKSNWFLGERRQQIRDALLALSPRDRVDAVKNIVDEVKKLQADPMIAPLLTQFNILENFEAIFTDELISGKSSKNSFDRFFGNFETAAEGLFSVFLVARLGFKSIKGVFKASDANKIRQTAKHVGNREVQQFSDQRLQGTVGRAMGLKESDTVVQGLPRPTLLEADREVVPPMVFEQSEAAGRVKDELFNSNNVPLGEILSGSDKAKAVDSAIEDIGLTDNMVPMPGMSVIEPLDDGTGVGIRLVLGKTETDAYDSLDQLLPDLMHLDPEYKNLKIVQRGPDGTLVDVKLSKDELVNILSNEPIAKLDDAELIRRSGLANKGSTEYALLEREAAKRAGLDTKHLDAAMKDEYFLEHTQVRKWHPADATAFAGDTLKHTFIPEMLLTPNAKFGSNIVTNFFRNYAKEQRTIRLFERIYQPYYKLSQADKRRVAGIYEWTEQFGKEQGRNPTMVEVAADFGDLTPKQWAGYVALRDGYDAQYTVFNTRLYEEMLGRGLKTARPVDPNAPLYHGKPILRDNIKKGEYFDPAKNEMVTLTKTQADDLYQNGGSLIELDIPVNVPGAKGAKQYKTVVVDGQDYELGSLSKKPLDYYPGYNYRFYDDPYYLVKHHENVTIDGKAVAGKHGTEEAVRTVGSLLEGEQYLERNFTRGVRTLNGAERQVWISKKNPDVWYNLKPARDIDQVDNLLKQKQALHREGRLFWDSRRNTPLPDVNGNQARVMDFTRALERGTAIAARQNTQEDLMKTVKNSLAGQYKDLTTGKGRPIFTANKDIKQIVDELQAQVRNVADRDLKLRYKEALSVAKYIRIMEGVDSTIIPMMRRGVLNMAQWADRTVNKVGFRAGAFGSVEKRAQMLDPIRALRGTAFKVFMVLRPFRQAVLQGLQPLFLAGIDPVYVLSGKGFADALALRSGFIKYTVSDFDDGFSAAWAAKTMGLSKKEYTKLIKEFERSGLVDIVDVHSHSGGTRRFHKTKLLPESTGPIRKTAASARQMGGSLMEKAQQMGFDFGERMNRTATYNVAWRRLLKDKKYKSILEFTDKDWVKVQVDAENLALAMNSTNKMPYQTGVLSLTTQFLSFTHKLTLAMLFQNPALKNKEVLRLWVGMLAMYGADSIGQKDQVRRAMRDKGVDNEDVLDLVSAGVLETTLNKVGTLVSDDWERYDFANFKPTLTWGNFATMFYENMIRNPYLGSLGASGNVIGGFAESAEFARGMLRTGDVYTPTEKLTRILDMTSKNLVPQYRDATLAWHSHEVQKLYRQSGENTNLRSSWLSAVAKGTFGLRTEEEMAIFNMTAEASDKDQIVRDMIRANRKFIKQNFFLYEKGEYSQAEFMRAAETIAIFAGWAPDGRSQEVIEASMLEYFSDDDPATLPVAIMAEHAINNRVDKSFVVDAVMQNNDLTEEGKQRVLEIVEDGMDRRIMNQEELRQEIIKMNKRTN